jgi:hypothetical protein
MGSAGGVFREFIGLVVRFADSVDEEAKGAAVAELVHLAITYLRGRIRYPPRDGEPRRAKILGARGEVLQEVELPGDDEEPGPEKRQSRTKESQGSHGGTGRHAARRQPSPLPT